MKRLLVSAAGLSVIAAGLTTTTALASPAPAGVTHRNVPVCAAPAAGYAACNAIRHDTYRNGKPVRNTGPSGYGPTDLQGAYGLGGGSGQTVAIVDAYDDPTAADDLAVYRSQFGLPACGDGCLAKVDQTGGTNYPRANGGWAQEISLDLDMVSAACPGCHILLVEAASSSFADLAAAVDYAARQPSVVAISNSYGGGDQAELSEYNQPGIAITASTGDSGYGVESPASFPHVIAVGGTTLNKGKRGTWSQTAWSGAGSGCSTINPKPSWQSGTSCEGKANADVSAVADPATGVAVYDTTAYQGRSGWLVFGGTSVASPLVASAYAIGGNHGADYPASYTWGSTSGLTDVTSGSNGRCSTSVWCTAGTGWDGPTGLGTPNGTGAF